MKRFAVVIVFCSIFLISVICQPAFSQDGKAGYERIIKEFFEIYKSGDTDKAIDYIFSTSEYIGNESVTNVKGQLNNAKALVGEYYGYEFINSKTVGNSLVCVNYLVKYERQPLRFQIFFYKPSDKWMIFSFSFDDQLDEELEETTKISG